MNEHRRSQDALPVVTRVGSAAVVTVTGELDLHTARDLMAIVDDTRSQPNLAGVVVDLSECGFLGSAGLGTLAELATRSTGTDGSWAETPPPPLPPLLLVAPPENRAVLRPWETMNLQEIMPLHPHLNAALAKI